MVKRRIILNLILLSMQLNDHFFYDNKIYLDLIEIFTIAIQKQVFWNFFK